VLEYERQRYGCGIVVSTIVKFQTAMNAKFKID
jgi:hypothetical protein